jgi:hypothetical protein
MNSYKKMYVLCEGDYKRLKECENNKHQLGESSALVITKPPPSLPPPTIAQSDKQEHKADKKKHKVAKPPRDPFVCKLNSTEWMSMNN